MKFGKSIESQQECHEHLRYVNYKTLKKRIKDIVESFSSHELAEALDANSAMEEELAKEIAQVNECFVLRQKELLRQTSALAERSFDRHSITEMAETAGGSSGSGGGGGGACPPDIFRALVGILADVDQLRKYAVWNAVAVVKILKKRRKRTSYGLKDAAAERAGWLSRQTFFSDSRFAELHAAVDSVSEHVISRLAAVDGRSQETRGAEASESQQCPICLDTIMDKIELSCGHRFCWKCFVLGPIACQPGEYRIASCPLCRTETCPGTTPGTAQIDLTKGISIPGSKGILTRFLHTYSSPSGGAALGSCVVPGGGTAQEACREGEEQMSYVVGELLRALLADPSLQGPPDAGEAWPQQRGCCTDFFQTLPAASARPALSDGAQHKLQWLQMASRDDPLAVEGEAYCSLCSEPLLLDAVLTTPCKHQFHRVCVGRIDQPECPLCREALPFSWFVPADHPCCEEGFQVVSAKAYRPCFAGGPSRGSSGYPLHRPPPVALHGPQGLVMRSYLHRLAPLRRHEGGGETPRSRCKSGQSSAVPPSSPDTRLPQSPERECPSPGGPVWSSLEHVGADWEAASSDDEDSDAASAAASLQGESCEFAYSSLGKIPLLQR